MAASANLPVYGINILLFSDSVSIVTNKQYSLIKGAYEMRFKKQCLRRDTFTFLRT